MASDYLAQSEETIAGGAYRLGAVVRRTVRSTIYEGEVAGGNAADARPIVIKTREAEGQEAEALAAKWREAAELEHPHLQRIYDAGTSLVEGVPAAYAVLERAEESLAGVLSDRALSRKEVKEMLPSLVDALAYLHKKGYAHGGVKPANVLAVGDQLKLSGDSATRVEHGGSKADDMRGLGVLLVQALTLKMPEEVDAAAYGFATEGEVIADVVRHCLDLDPAKRWTVEQVEQRLNGPLPAPAPPPNVIEVPRARIEEWKAQTTVTKDDLDKEERESYGVPKWVLAGLAALVLLVALYAFMRRNNTGEPATAEPPASQTAPAQTPQAAVPAAPVVAEHVAPVHKPSPIEKSRRTETPSPLAGRPEKAAADGSATGRRADGWSVIVAAYGSRDAAEKRVKEMAKRYPKFNLQVQEQNTDRARFLVVLGQNLPEDQADALKLRALRSGLPHDTYIKRVM